MKAKKSHRKTETIGNRDGGSLWFAESAEEVMLYPTENYKPEWFAGWECGCCKNGGARWLSL